jgi:CHAD domain-containing protein/CYTH domain-containing protein
VATFDAGLLDEDELRGARIVALTLLRDAAAEHTRLLETPDREALHDFRVAVRRLRTWLRAQKGALEGSVPRAARRDLRRVARATNASRDAEVFAEWLESTRATLKPSHKTGANWLLAQVTSRKEKADARAMDQLSERFTRARELLEDRLQFYRQVHHLENGRHVTPFGGEMATLIRIHSIALSRRLDRVRDPRDADEAHRGRIAGKRLRYLLEPVAPHVAGGREAVAQLKLLQDTLGDFHDAHVWLDALRTHHERQGREESRLLARVDIADDAIRPPRANRQRAGLMAIAEALRRRALERFEAFQRDWGPEQLGQLHEKIDAIAQELEQHGARDVEIERKYLLTGLPPAMPQADVVTMEQGYLPGERLVERLRREVSAGGECFTRTVKTGAGIARSELEEATTRGIFYAMWPLTSGRRVSKRRHRVRAGALTWEIDEFTDRDLVVAEVELRDASLEPAIPDWLKPVVVREVTGEPEYVNANLAR